MLDHWTAASLTFLPPSLRARLFSGLRALEPPALARLDSAWLRRAIAAALQDETAARAAHEEAARRATQALEIATRTEIYAVTWGADAYPLPLTHIADPPPLLWHRGDPRLFSSPCLAIVGSRAASPYGIEVATRLAAELGRVGLTVVSGLARGVDSAAHRGALTTGRTIAVLGSGVDVIYPPEHRPLAAEIVARGSLITSELPPGAAPRRDHFPRRNRLISGLSLGVLVIEASNRSGSLQTARFAAEQGREVLAVPGSVLSERNRGAHGLLRDGAILVEQADDVLRELRLQAIVSAPDSGSSSGSGSGHDSGPGPASIAGALSGADSIPAPAGACRHENDTSPAGAALAAMADGEVYDFQTLAGATGLPADALLRALLRLELDGRVARTGDGRFLRAGRPVIR